MNVFFKGLLLILLFMELTISKGFSGESSKKDSLHNAIYLSLDLKILQGGNQIDKDGLIHKFEAPVIHLFRTNINNPKGTILLLPGGAYMVLSAKAEGANTAQFLNTEGFDVALLEYHIVSGSKTRDLALEDALKAFRLIKSNPKSMGLHKGRIGIMGYSAGGHLAARTVQDLKKKELPDDLILTYPAYLDETLPGTLNHSVIPPKDPKGRLFLLISDNDRPEWVKSCQEYTKIWKDAGGFTSFQLLHNGGHGFGIPKNPADAVQNWTSLLKVFLETKSGI